MADLCRLVGTKTWREAEKGAPQDPKLFPVGGLRGAGWRPSVELVVPQGLSESPCPPSAGHLLGQLERLAPSTCLSATPVTAVPPCLPLCSGKPG